MNEKGLESGEDREWNMERLTCKYENDIVLKAMCTFDRESDTEPDDCMACVEFCEEFVGKSCSLCPVRQAFDRLSSYEDTGLTPEQIKEVDRLYAEKCRELEILRKEQEDGKTGIR